MIANQNKEKLVRKLAEMLTKGKIEYEVFAKVMAKLIPKEGILCFTEEGWEEEFTSLIPNYEEEEEEEEKDQYCCMCWDFADCECKCACHSEEENNEYWQCEECEMEYQAKIPFVNINDYKYCLECCDSDCV